MVERVVDRAAVARRTAVMAGHDLVVTPRLGAVELDRERAVAQLEQLAVEAEHLVAAAVLTGGLVGARRQVHDIG